MELEEAVERLCTEAARLGAEAYDAVGVESESMGVEVFEGRLKNTELSVSRGAGIRLFRNGRPGYSFSERFSPDSLRTAVEDAWSHAALTDPLPLELPDATAIPDRDLDLYTEALEAIDFDFLRSHALAIEGAALAGDARVENVPHLGASRSSGRSVLMNSKGLAHTARRNSLSAYVGVLAASGRERKMGSYGNSARRSGADVLRPDFMAGRAVERAVELLEARPVPAGTYPIVFSNRVSGRIFGMFLSVFHAEAVQKEQSRLVGCLNTEIADERLIVSCLPHLRGEPGSRLRDGEGVPTRALTVIDRGYLRAYLYNLESAARDQARPTGHGSRGYSGRASTGTSNIVVSAGKSSLHDLLQGDRLIHIVKLEGGAGCSAVSGEISIGAQGFLYENGRCVQPVDRITLSTNFFDLIRNIRGVSSEYSDAWSSLRVPDLLVESVALGS